MLLVYRLELKRLETNLIKYMKLYKHVTDDMPSWWARWMMKDTWWTDKWLMTIDVSNDELLFWNLTWFIWTHESASWYGRNLRASRASLSLVQASRPYAYLVAGVKGQTSRAVELEHSELVRKLVELHAAVEAVAGARVDEVALALALKFGSGILRKKSTHINWNGRKIKSFLLERVQI